MATSAQIDANLANAAHSTGPVTSDGKAASSQNHFIHGLYSRLDYVKPEEFDLYIDFCQDIKSELGAEGRLEEAFVAEITGATWRLRRCSDVESGLAESAAAGSGKDPLLDPNADKTIRSLERARASAHSLLNRSIANLRKLQTERLTRNELKLPHPEVAPLSEVRETIKTMAAYQKTKVRQQKQTDQALDAYLNAPMPPVDWERVRREAAEKKAAAATQPTELASNCKPASEAPAPARTRLCPCKSGKKYKHCCGKNAPWQSGMAA